MNVLPPYKCVAYSSPGVRVDLQYFGKVGGRAKFVESSCFEGNYTAYMSLANPILLDNNYEISFSYIHAQTDNVHSILGNNVNNGGYRFSYGGVEQLISFRNDSATSFSQIQDSTAKFQIGEKYNVVLKRESGVHSVFINGIDRSGTDNPTGTFTLSYIFSANDGNNLAGGSIWNLKVWKDGILQDALPLCEPIELPSSHTYHDVSGSGNHATLINGTLANEGKQDEFHYLQKGYNNVLIADYEDTVSPTGASITKALSGNYNIAFWHKQLALETGSFYVLDTRGSFGGSDYILTGQSSVGGDLYIDGILQGSFVLPRDGILHYIEMKNITIQSCTGAMIGRRYTNEEFHKRLSIDIYGLFNRTEVLPLLNPTAIIDSKIIPSLQSDPTTDALGNPTTVLQDGKSFLDTGCELQQYQYPSMIQADTENIWYDTDGTPKERNFEFTTFGKISDKYYCDNSSREEGKTTDITTYRQPLLGRQAITEPIIRNSTEYIFNDAFQMRVDMSDSEEMVIPATGTNDFYIDWGDGSPIEYVNTSSPPHVYTSAGEYLIKIDGTMASFRFNNGGNKLNLIGIDQFGSTGLVWVSGFAYGCSNCEYINGEDFDTSNITSLSQFARGCINMLTFNVANWDTTNILSVYEFAASCLKLQVLDVSAWDLTICTNFGGFINDCKLLTLLDVSNWNTNSATSFSSFAIYCAALQDCDTIGFDMTNVTSVQNMFNYCNSITNAAPDWWNTYPGIATTTSCFSNNTSRSNWASIPASYGGPA